jgi:serine kinase of HPr protein (carbohydrate metabolism regulator)
VTVTSSATLHASCVCWLARGVLLTGPSGIGKSDLALRLIDAGAMLVADDLVALSRSGMRVVARPVALPGLIELRGQGIYRMEWQPQVPIDLYVRLGARDIERLPAVERSSCLLDVELPAIDLDPSLPSAVARLRVALCGTRAH